MAAHRQDRHRQAPPGGVRRDRTCCRLLGAQGKALDEERVECRKRAYALADDPWPIPSADPAHLARMVETRAWSYEIALRRAGALVASAGGRAMQRSHPAQRLLREAAFFSIQAQSADLRLATLDRLQGLVSKTCSSGGQDAGGGGVA